MPAFADELRSKGAGLRVPNLAEAMSTQPRHGVNVVHGHGCLVQMKHEIKRERVTGSISKRREAGKDLGSGPRRVTDSQIRSAVRLVKGGDPAAQVARDFGMS